VFLYERKLKIFNIIWKIVKPGWVHHTDSLHVHFTLPAGLQGEGNVDVADREPLSVNGADTDTPIIGIHARELGDVGCHLEQHKPEKGTAKFSSRFFRFC
jgi:hypothetical protein